MKRIIIVNNNMKVGGVQKSLYNLLWAIDGRYDITLFLFSPVGEYMNNLPPSVRVVGCTSLFRYLGISQAESSADFSDRIKRSFLAAVFRILGRSIGMRILLASQTALPERYDCAISFLHNGRRKSFYGGVQDFVLRRINADKKVAFLHCDYRNCGANYPENNREMAKFDIIAACSDGCRRAFEEVLPNLGEKCITVRNCHRFDEIRSLAGSEPVLYEKEHLNVITVARLAHEKGIDRTIEAAAYSIKKGLPVTLHIVGAGPMEESLRSLADVLGVSGHVVFHGEQRNPYRFMVNADLFILSSYHEAAPMVIEEAHCLGLPVLTVKTTSSDEMVTVRECGWVCENSREALTASLYEILSDRTGLVGMKKKLLGRAMDNTEALGQFDMVIGK